MSHRNIIVPLLDHFLASSWNSSRKRQALDSQAIILLERANFMFEEYFSIAETRQHTLFQQTVSFLYKQ